ESQSSWTKTSMASMMTARYPERTGIMRAEDALPEDAVLPAEIFSEAGYKTAGVWRNGWVANNFGFDQGFGLYYKPLPDRSNKSVQRNSPSAHHLAGTDLDVTRSAIEFISNHRNDRFFLYMHYMDVHQYVYSDVSPTWGTGFSDIYDSSIHWVDQNVGLIAQTLFDQELLDRTIIVIAADHGEGFFEHGAEGHARSLYREVQNVPLIIVPPLRLEEGVVVEEKVANVDIWPTVLELAGLPPIPGAEGRSLVPLILDESGQGTAASELRNRPLFAQLEQHWGKRNKESDALISMLDGPYRYIVRANDPERFEIYDHSKDPLEKENLASGGEVSPEDLQVKVDAFLESGGPVWGDSPKVPVDEMMQAQLRALGYVFTMTDAEELRRRDEHAKEIQKNQKWEAD
ncbi:MAG: sulfatase-like hydrolase/transferase, partial [Myxococcota bacterium]|nr:sulfatase-like hydrolase/transferase [Myxococcota bacterium]